SSQWCLYIAAEDAAAAAARIREHGGELLMNPMPVGDFGTMCLARDPGGVVFGVWQAGTHEGFQAMAVPGAACGAAVHTRDPDASDAFFPAVFSYRQKQLTDEMDFRIYDLGEQSVLGGMGLTADFPPEVPPYINVYSTVPDCDAAGTRPAERGGTLRSGPRTRPFGR